MAYPHPVDINIKPGEPGLKKIHPIALGDDEPKATSSICASSNRVETEDVEVKAEEDGESLSSATDRKLAEARVRAASLGTSSYLPNPLHRPDRLLLKLSKLKNRRKLSNSKTGQNRRVVRFARAQTKTMK